MILRDPVERAISQFQSSPPLVRSGKPLEEWIQEEKKSLEEIPEGCSSDDALQSRKTRSICQASVLLNRGIYLPQIRNWLKYYPMDQMLILRAEDFFADPNGEIRKILRFLELKIDENSLPGVNPEKHAESETKTEVRIQTRKLLEDFYRPHNRLLADFLGRDFRWSS